MVSLLSISTIFFNEIMFSDDFSNPASTSIQNNSTENNSFDVFQSSDQHSKLCRSFPDSHRAGNVIVVTSVTIPERRSLGGGGGDDCGSVLFNRWRWMQGSCPGSCCRCCCSRGAAIREHINLNPAVISSCKNAFPLGRCTTTKQ